MQPLNFPKPFVHEHEPVQNVNDLFAAKGTFGHRAADWVALMVGSWNFIITQSCLMFVWLILNIISWLNHWDPYPFILMNLVLSTQAAFTAPIIMMSQNRQAAKDRIEAHQDYLINQKSEAEVRAILDHLAAQDDALLQIFELLKSLQKNNPTSAD